MAKQITLIKGEDINIKISLKDKETAEPFALPGFVGATGYFSAEDGTTLSASGTLISSDAGRIDIKLNEDQTDLLAAGDEQSFELVVDYDSSNLRNIVQFEGALKVKERLF